MDNTMPEKKPRGIPERNEFKYLGEHVWFTEGFYSTVEQQHYDFGWYFSTPFEDLEGPFESLDTCKDAMDMYARDL